MGILGGTTEWNDDMLFGPCIESPICARTSNTLPTFAVRVVFKLCGYCVGD